ncbi:MAG: glycosyltransferase family 2 protein [Pseudomonadota bacterium]
MTEAFVTTTILSPQAGSVKSSTSVILPARNEAASIGPLVAALLKLRQISEVIVVDDGSTDDTGIVASTAGARVVRHPVSRGNGAAIKSGARAATGEVLVMMDADGQHQPEDVPLLLTRLEEGFDLVIGARSASAHANLSRRFANGFYNGLASWLTEQPIRDLTSGFRAVRRSAFLPFLPLLPNRFSYPTTSTMCLIRAGYGVHFEPVNVLARTQGTASHIRPLRDGGRFVLIIIKIATLYSPLKVFGTVAAALFASGAWYYAYTFITEGRFTNAGALLFTTSILTFLMGLVSEQITQLLYASTQGPSDPNAPSD